MSYESDDSVPIDEIAGVEYDPALVEEMNTNVEPFNDMMDDVSVATSESVDIDLRKNNISNISVPKASGTRAMNIEGSLLKECNLAET